jgi:methylenetetrahydrofolate dehydrogenase (NADP+) / methenyltetrahydrofolate cyclohydrolase
MATILDGKKIAERRLEILKDEIEGSGLHPRLATVIVGRDPASQMYVRMKHRACEKVGIGSVGRELAGDSTTEQVLHAVTQLSNDTDIDGVLIQLPLPNQVETERVIAAVHPKKDVDGFHPFNLGLLFSGRPQFVPCTPKGIMALLAEYRVEIAGKRAVVAGRSIEVGRPMSALFTNADATVTLCHSKTRDLAKEISQADILVSAIGKAHFITQEMVKPGAVIVDAGINQLNGRITGDVDLEAVSSVASAITPVPGGVGPMTIASLMENTHHAASLRTCDPAW